MDEERKRERVCEGERVKEKKSISKSDKDCNC